MNRLGRIIILGAVAQLEERLICIQEVVGSIPIGSTNRILLGIWAHSSAG